MFGIIGLSLVVGVVAGSGFVLREATWRDPIYFAVLVAGLVGTWLVRGDTSQPSTFIWGTRNAQLAVSTVWALTAACMYHEYTLGGTKAALLLYAKVVIFSFLLIILSGLLTGTAKKTVEVGGTVSVALVFPWIAWVRA